MIDKLRKLLGLCSHKYVIIKEGSWTRTRGNDTVDKGRYYDCRCENCGKIKEFRT